MAGKLYPTRGLFMRAASTLEDDYFFRLDRELIDELRRSGPPAVTPPLPRERRPPRARPLARPESRLLLRLETRLERAFARVASDWRP